MSALTSAISKSFNSRANRRDLISALEIIGFSPIEATNSIDILEVTMISKLVTVEQSRFSQCLSRLHIDNERKMYLTSSFNTFKRYYISKNKCSSSFSGCDSETFTYEFDISSTGSYTRDLYQARKKTRVLPTSMFKSPILLATSHHRWGTSVMLQNRRIIGLPRDRRIIGLP